MSMLVDAYRFGGVAPTDWATVVAALNPEVWLRFNETSGSVFADSSGNGNDGTKFGNPVLNQAAIFANMGPCALFNFGPSDEYASIPDTAGLRFTTGDFLLLHAFKREGTTVPNFAKLAWKPTDEVNGFANYGMIYIKSTDKILGRVTHSGTTNVDVTCTTTIALATSYLVGLRRIGDEISIWVNGVKEATNTLPSPSTALDTSADPLDFFGGPSAGGDPFSAYGDESIVIPGTVTDGDMAALWAARD